MGKLKATKTVEEFIDFAPCIKCGSEDIRFYNCGYSTFNIGSATCNQCGNKVTSRNIDWNAPDSDLVPYWNQENDPILLKRKYLSQIDELVKLINELPK